MSFEKGHKRIGGRRPGSRNKVSADLRKLLLGGAQRAGNKIAREDKEPGPRGIQRWLAHCAEKYPETYLAMIGKMLPRDLQVDGNITVAPQLPKPVSEMSVEELEHFIEVSAQPMLVNRRGS